MDFCPTCGQKQKLAHKEILTRNKIDMLKRAANHVMTTMKNEFPLKEYKAESYLYNNFQKLRYHGLIHYVTNRQGERKAGQWLITRNGWAFLRGEIELPYYVLIKNNHIQSRADLLINVRDVMRGDPVLSTSFEYFTDEGVAIGYRPTQLRNSLFKQIGMEF
jgi:hypothetical protein